MCWPFGAKFCTVVSTRPNFVMLVQNFGGPFPKKFMGQKHAKFGSISDDFEVRQQISREWMKIFEIGQVYFVSGFLARCVKKVR